MRCIIVLTGLQVIGSKHLSLRDFERASINIFGPCLNLTQYYPIYDSDIRKICLYPEPCSWWKDSPLHGAIRLSPFGASNLICPCRVSVNTD